MFLFSPPPQQGFHAPLYVVDMSKLEVACYLEVPLGLLFKYPSLLKQSWSLPSSTHVKPPVNICLCVCPTSVPQGQVGGQLGAGDPAPAPPNHRHLSVTELGCLAAPLLQPGERHAGCRLSRERARACPRMAKYGTGGGQSCAWVSCRAQMCWVNPEMVEDG